MPLVPQAPLGAHPGLPGERFSDVGQAHPLAPLLHHARRVAAEQVGVEHHPRLPQRVHDAYGLVEVRPKVGATNIDNRMARAFELFSFDFPHISRETFADVQGFRVLLEVAAADQLLERATETDVADLREINARLLTARSITEAAGVDFEMHLRLVSIFENRAILDVYRMMKPVILRIMAIRKTRRTFGTLTYSEHEAVIDALEARDRIAYQYRLQTHLEFGFAHFDDATETEP